MATKCSNPACYVSDGETCLRGKPNHETCPDWQKGADTEVQEQTISKQAEARLPWSGSALGLSDLMMLVPRARHMLIGVIGAHDSGKTTLLTASYLQLLQTGKFGNAGFVGSRTLGAWESLAAWMRFDEASRQPTFPPHTPPGTNRVPGLLHLALRNEQDEFRDVLLTDAPGEWFSSWAVNEDAPDAAGARWVVEHADAFLVIADSARLAGVERASARKELRQLIERLDNHLAKRPIILVWSKTEPEHTVPTAIRTAITDALQKLQPDAVHLSVTITQPDSFMHAVDSMITRCWHAPAAQAITAPITVFEPFYAFRGTHGAA